MDRIWALARLVKKRSSRGRREVLWVDQIHLQLWNCKIPIGETLGYINTALLRTPSRTSKSGTRPKRGINLTWMY